MMRRMSWVGIVVASALALVAAILAAFWLGQERLIFFPQPVTSTAHLPASAAPLALRTDDGTELAGWIVPAALTPAPAVVYFGGNAEEVSWALADGRWPRGVTLVALNYRGYGTSGGTPSADKLLADGVALYDFVAARGDVDPASITVFGRSLGTAVATHVAAHRPVARAILVSPYDSLAAVGSRHYPFLPVGLLLRHRFAPVGDAPSCRAPLLALVGSADAVIPTSHSRALFDAWAGPKQWVEVAGAGHDTLGATREMWGAVREFLTR